MKRVLIVGGGASGILVAINMARLASSEVEVVIAEPRMFLGQGIAYSTTDPGHVLNVPASRMSAFVDRPSHFEEWGAYDANHFAPRSEYGRYLLETFVQLQTERNIAQFEHRRATVKSISPEDERFMASFDSGPEETFDSVVLAIGHGKAISHPAIAAEGLSSKILQDAWLNPLTRFRGCLLCIGTGLTFFDHALSHLRADPSNSVIGVSRSGLLPEPHLAHRSPPLEVPDSAKVSPVEMRNFIESSADWRAAQDGIRHELPEIWHSWSENLKQEFLANQLRWWNSRRHRVAPSINEEVNAALKSGRMKVLKGNLESVIDDGSKLKVYIDGSNFDFDGLVNCLGYEPPGMDSLLGELIRQGLSIRGPLGLGIRSDFPRQNVIGESGEANQNIYVIGPALFGERFETTAVPELRVQAQEIAQEICRTL